jgi:uncharacterized membrane protein YhfC
VKDDGRTAIFVAVAIIVAVLVLSFLLVSVWWDSCSKWDIDAPDLRVGWSVFTTIAAIDLRFERSHLPRSIDVVAQHD